MNIARVSSTGMTALPIAVMPPSSDEYVCQSRLTAWMSSCVVTDQKPGSPGYSVKCEVQWIGHCPRSRSKVCSGGPSSHNARSVTRTSSSGTVSAAVALSGEVSVGMARA